MPGDLRPPELARLVDFAERSRVGDWSLRSALMRYAQGEPVRVSQVIELVRRIEAALRRHGKLLASQGPALWSALRDEQGGGPGPTAGVVELLRVAVVLDGLGDELAAWAEDRHHQPRPDRSVDVAVATVSRRLDELGVPREDRRARPRARRSS